MIKWYEDYDVLVEKLAPDYYNTLQGVQSNIKPCKKIIEVACGTGNLTLKLANKFPQTSIHAIDHNQELLAIAKRKLEQFNKVTFQEANILDIDFSEGDVVVGTYIFHLLPKKERYRLFDKMIKAGVSSIFIADRLAHKEDKLPYDNFVYKFRLSNELPLEVINRVTEENKDNQLETIEEQSNYFVQRGYFITIHFTNQDHGFMSYSFHKIE